jgi:hypothetical protein
LREVRGPEYVDARKIAQFVTTDRMRAVNRAFGGMRSQASGLSLDVVPAQPDQLGEAKTVAPVHADRERIPQPISPAALPRGSHQCAVFVLGQVFARAALCSESAALGARNRFV